MYRTCDICKCKKFRVKRIVINVIKTTTGGGIIQKDHYGEAKYMCPVCRRLHKEKKLTDNELFGKQEILTITKI